MSKAIEKMWDLLNDLEDMLEGGYKTARSSLRFVDPAQGDTVSAPDMLAALEAEVRACKRCELGLNRNNAVPGAGPQNPRVFVIGEGPGAEEDRSGMPFVGRAGRYLDKWLSAIELSRKTDTYIGNIVKCRPPGNRDPRPEEISACLPYLIRQIEILKPRTILTVGRIAAQVLLDTSRGIGAIRGQVYLFHEIPLVATYHPSGVLRNPGYRQAVWDDLRLLKSLFDET
jgi:uracil-DNA glycosylase family 4